MMRKRIGILLGQPEEYTMNLFLKGFLDCAVKNDFDVCIFAMNKRYQPSYAKGVGDANIFSLVDYNSYDAIILVSHCIRMPGVTERIEEELHKTYDKPVICVDWESKYFPTFYSNNIAPTKKIISYLIEKCGYKDIAYLTGQEYHPHAIQRLQAFEECMTEHDLRVRRDRIFYGDFWETSGQGTAAKILQNREDLPEAIACANDRMAIGIINELTKEGFVVPDDIAVVGFDASIEGRTNNISITSVRMSHVEQGEYCFACLQALMQGEGMPADKNEPVMYLGKSCGLPEVDDASRWQEDFIVEDDAEITDIKIFEMEDDFILQNEKAGVIGIILSYIEVIMPFESFYLCLNEEWSNEDFDEKNQTAYSDRMLMAIKSINGVNEEFDARLIFDKKDLIFELNDSTRKPSVYYFSPLYYEDHCFGYGVLNPGDHRWCYKKSYVKWLSAVCRGLEVYRRKASLESVVSKMEIRQVRDEITGLFNYRGYVNTMVSTINDYFVGNAYLNVAVIELCGLAENFNKKKAVGSEQILADFAQILMTYAQGVACYLGGAEFLISNVSASNTKDNLRATVDNIKTKLEEYCKNNAYDGQLKIVEGILEGQVTNQEDIEDLILDAIGEKNVNLRIEKQHEESGLTEEDKNILKVVESILDNNLFSYHFQPIVSVGTGEIYAYEALMRANVEEKISPLDILKCANHLNRLDDIESATFFNVLSYVENHKSLFAGKKVFINSIPGTKLSDDEMNDLKERLKKLKGKAVVELTEQSELTDEELDDLKKRYKNIGVDIAVDDYGTGYSNVFNLLRYMPNVVKIDRMLLSGIELSPQKQHFVREIVEFSHKNNITVLAEGVETSEELKAVTLLGADLIQGYYTARPNSTILQQIDVTIMNEMIQYGQYALGKDKRKEYRAGQDATINLVKLVTGHYSKIVFPADKNIHKVISMTGLQGFSAEVEVDIMDGFAGTIELKDADIVGKHEQPAIKIGENCDVVLMLTGSNILEHGGILVPESSKLTFLGDGNLEFKQIAVNGYGIGNDSNSKCGELIFEQDGQILIRGNTVRGVGIGAGLGGIIRINRGMYDIQLYGEDAVAIGALENSVDINITNCRIMIELKNRTSVGIGTLQGSADIKLSFTYIEIHSSSRNCVCIGTLKGDMVSVDCKEGIVEIVASGEKICGIGNYDGDASISTDHFSLRVNAQGDGVFAVGNSSQTAKLNIFKTETIFNVKNELGFIIGAVE
ncbi:MAG: EAL domain-containing protein [Pseudobutyrivibrio sp.]|nr:EAL domain-containing protein [Pseudobutyrivibrio sp.]